jgi:hypothetical protein
MGKDDADARLWEELRARLTDDDPVPETVLAEAYDALHRRGEATQPDDQHPHGWEQPDAER